MLLVLPKFPRMNKAPGLIVVTGLILLLSCTSSKKISNNNMEQGRLRFINEYAIPQALQFKGTTVGGLSGIDYNPGNGLYYMISDDRSDKQPARFYTARIHIREGRIDSVELTDMITLLDENGRPYPNKKTDSLRTPDPESIRYNPKNNQLVWSSEGDRAARRSNPLLVDPAIYYMDLSGRYKAKFEMPANLHMQLSENGPRQNGVLEGISFSEDYRYLFASVEEPLFEDGRRAGSGDSSAWVRFLKFDTESKKQVAQYAYQIDPIPYPSNPPGGFRVNGISEIMYIGNEQFIVIERAFVSGRTNNGIRVFLADTRNSSDISSIPSLITTPASKPIAKKLLLNMDDLGRYIDNVEGVTFGPNLPNGHRSLIFISDDNFGAQQKTQFFLFELLP
jgi:hypothetical protein